MCVNTSHQAWERPATLADCQVLARHFSEINFEDMHEVMSQDGAKPLTTDLVLLAAMMHTPSDEGGMRYVPFSAIENVKSQAVVKLPVMDQIVEWYENTALGTDMWSNASDWCEEKMGARVHFAMNCGCGLVATSAYATGQWSLWKQRFNVARAHLFGRTTVIKRDTNSLVGLDMTAAQLMMWHRMRRCLEDLAATEVTSSSAAA
jgi:hypothetical protein